MQRFTVIPPTDLSACWDFVGEPTRSLEVLIGLGPFEVVAKAAVQNILTLPPSSDLLHPPKLNSSSIKDITTQRG